MDYYYLYAANGLTSVCSLYQNRWNSPANTLFGHSQLYPCMGYCWFGCKENFTKQTLHIIINPLPCTPLESENNKNADGFFWHCDVNTTKLIIFRSFQACINSLYHMGRSPPVTAVSADLEWRAVFFSVITGKCWFFPVLEIGKKCSYLPKPEIWEFFRFLKSKKKSALTSKNPDFFWGCFLFLKENQSKSA